MIPDRHRTRRRRGPHCARPAGSSPRRERTGCAGVSIKTKRCRRVPVYVAAQREKLAESAEKIKDSTYRVEDSAERTTQLAADRTVFAAERTYAAWVRTGLLALASGIGAKALLAELLPQWLIIATGSVLVLFSAFCFGAAVWRHLYPGVPPPRIDVSRIPPWILIAVNGFLALVALAALVGIWFGRAASPG